MEPYMDPNGFRHTTSHNLYKSMDCFFVFKVFFATLTFYETPITHEKWITLRHPDVNRPVLTMDTVSRQKKGQKTNETNIAVNFHIPCRHTSVLKMRPKATL